MRRTLTLGNTLRLRAHRTMVLIPRPFAQVKAVFTGGPTGTAPLGKPVLIRRKRKPRCDWRERGDPSLGFMPSRSRAHIRDRSPVDVSKLSIGSVKRVISFARASTPNRALALRRGLGDYQVVSSAPPLLLILPTSVLTTQGAAVRVCVSMANAPVDRQRRSPIPNSEPICSDVKRSSITSWRNLFRVQPALTLPVSMAALTPACCIAVATPFELDPRP